MVDIHQELFIRKKKKKKKRMFLECFFSRGWLAGQTVFNISSVIQKQIKITAENTCCDKNCQHDK